MATTTIAACPCNWDANFTSSTNCVIPSPGLNRCVLVFCRDKIQAHTISAADQANADTTGVLTHLDLNANEAAFIMFANNNTVNATTSETVNDQGSKDVNETLTGQGTIGTQEFNFLRQHIGKEVVIIYEDNDNQVWIMGHDSGFTLTTWDADWGTTQGDFKGVNFTFSNTTRSGVVEVDMAAVGASAVGGAQTFNNFSDLASWFTDSANFPT